MVEEVPSKISEDKVLPKIHSKADVCRNISMEIHYRRCLQKYILADTTFLETPALECNFIPIFLQTLEIKYIFGGTSFTYKWEYLIGRRKLPDPTM